MAQHTEGRITRIPVIGPWIKQRRREKHKSLGNDPNRAEGERPYEDMPEDQLRKEYRQLGQRIRESDSGFGLSPLIDRNWNLRKELEHRDIDPEEVWDPDD